MVVRRAGTQTAVGHAIGKSAGTLGHYCTDRPHPVLVKAFKVLLALNGSRGVSAQAFAEAAQETVELSAFVLADTRTKDIITGAFSHLAFVIQHQGLHAAGL